MAATDRVSAKPAANLGFGRVTSIRIAIVAVLVLGWEAISASGLLFRDVVPSVVAIGKAVVSLLADGSFYENLGVTALEVFAALLTGGVLGFITGLVLGGNRLLGRAFEPYLYYLGPTPKIIFFPILIMWFGVGSGSKVAMGAVSCFFPVALSVAAGMRQINPVIIRVGRSFRAKAAHMITKIYLPAMRHPIINGARLGLGVAVVGTLLAETKLSNRGLGFLIINSYSTFDMPKMYALLFVVFVVAIVLNALVARMGGADFGRAARRSPVRPFVQEDQP